MEKEINELRSVMDELMECMSEVNARIDNLVTASEELAVSKDETRTSVPGYMINTRT